MKKVYEERTRLDPDAAEGAYKITRYDRYVEFEVKADRDNSGYAYVMPMEDKQALRIMAILPDAYDQISRFSKMDLSTLEQRIHMPEAHPESYRLLMNGRDKHFRDGAMIVAEDPDTQKTCLAIVTNWGNCDFSQAREEIEDRLVTVFYQAGLVVEEFAKIIGHPVKSALRATKHQSLNTLNSSFDEYMKLVIKGQVGEIKDLFKGE
ncbi:MAG TPA: hypothetical protein PK537_11925 [Candidatus Limiplasma sp.]|nr:hypothetical protein [Candidatus Limiplasma sp.]